MRIFLILLLRAVMGWSQRFGAYLKTTRVVKLLMSAFEYFYIRWRVMRTTSSDFDTEDDSHDSSYYEAHRRRIVRTNSVYPPVCPTSMRDGAIKHKPTCIELYKQFMSYGAVDEIIPGHIFLSNSASYYATKDTSLCQLSLPDSDSDIPSWSDDVVQDSDLESEVCSEVDSEDYSCRVYRKWIRRGDKKKIKRLLPLTPTEEAGGRICPAPEPVEKRPWSFEHYHRMSLRGAESTTYAEVQRQIRNYFFTSPIYFESDDNRWREERRIDEEEQSRKPPIYAERLDENSYENVYLRQVAEELEQRRLIYDSLEPHYLAESFSIPSEFSSNDTPREYDSNSSDYQTASISSAPAKEISDRFSSKYWRVEDHNGDGAIGARDNYHNRYFGKAGYYLTRNAIQNQANGRDTMPGVERRALEVERRRWTEINRRGGRYEDVELALPDTNGTSTNHWDAEYEEPLPLHTCSIWRTPKKYTPRYTSLF